MTACAIPLRTLATSPRWQDNVLKVLPAVKTHAQISFRRRNPTDQEEAAAEALASACVSYTRLARQKKLARVYPRNIAINAIKAVRSGRHVGGHQNCRDVFSPLAAKNKGVVGASLSPWCGQEDTWKDMQLESRKISPADQACFNLDFATWLKQWPARHRKIINAWASGERTTNVAERFGVTLPRISQLRREYQRSWEQFHHALTTRTAA